MKITKRLYLDGDITVACSFMKPGSEVYFITYIVKIITIFFFIIKINSAPL